MTERRRSRRIAAAADHRIVSACVRPNHRVRLIDVSAGGALLETNHRLLPGTSVDVHLETATRERQTICGVVVRCAVVRLRASFVCYQGAVAFDEALRWFGDRPGYGVPMAVEESGRAYRPVASAATR